MSLNTDGLRFVGLNLDRMAMESFHKLSGWPMLYCGMGGLMRPVLSRTEKDLEIVKNFDFS